MKTIRTLFIISVIGLVTAFNYSFGQEIEANVTVNLEQLTFEARNSVSSMANDLMRYINSQSFTGEKWEGEKIPVEINIYLTGGMNNIYGARLFLVSKRKLDTKGGEDAYSVTLKMKDDKWSFEYSTGANLSFNILRFDRFTSLIDYYMLLVIGFDMDTYGELDGSQCFDKAKSIVQLGASNNVSGYQTQSQPGEFTRFNLVNELTDMRYEDLRKLFFAYYVDGLDKMAYDKKLAVETIEYLIKQIALFKKDKMTGPSVLLQLFFDSKAQEIASIFKGYKNPDIFKILIYLDPSNTILYEDTRDGKN